jgi:dUTP pyrophosphatase
MTAQNNGLTLRVKRLTAASQLPTSSHLGDAGLDLFSVENATLQPGDSQMIRTGIAIELPSGTEGQIRPRSGLALEHRVTVLNAPGTVDQGYRGEIGVILINHGRTTFEITAGMRIAQLVVKPVFQVSVVEESDLKRSERGTGGFGSSGQ